MKIYRLTFSAQAGNQTATIVSLACLKDHDLTTEVNQSAIKDIGGLEVLTNLLETDDLKCKVRINRLIVVYRVKSTVAILLFYFIRLFKVT